MEQTPNADESAVISDTNEQLDTWNLPRSKKVLRNFVTSRMVRIGDIDDLDDLELAA